MRAEAPWEERTLPLSLITHPSPTLTPIAWDTPAPKGPSPKQRDSHQERVVGLGGSGV